MRFSKLPGRQQVSALGFGCGAVMGRAGRKKSLRAMELAFDAGVNLFDTARSYGYGDSEAVLGEFAHGRRDQILISTKFGIQPSQRQTWKRAIRPAARLLLRAAPGARAAVRSHAGSQLDRGVYSAAAMRKSLEDSLARLRTDHVDFFFVHDIQPDALRHGEAEDELFFALAELRTLGKVRWTGVSSSVASAAASLQLRPQLEALQMPANISTFAEAKLVARQAEGRILLGNHLFGGVDGQATIRQKLRSMAQAKALPTDLREKLAACAVDSTMVAAVMDLALRGLGCDAILTSMMEPKHIAANVAAVETSIFSDAELQQLSDALAVQPGD
jgi:aryl-alcohol dehydrogenase-like predicted oxidoreductase